MARHRSLLIVFVIVSCVFITATCINKNDEGEDEVHQPAANSRWEEFAGSSSCAGCHKNIYEGHIKTAHYLTSQPALEKYIKGSFETGKNLYAYTDNYSVVVAMEKRGNTFYQVEYFRGKEKKAFPFNIVIGSGTMGQSYLTWRNDHLFQLPITYFSAANAWSNSPGFPDKVFFNRIITSRCLECHVTYIDPTSERDKVPEKFSPNKIMYGVDCEKCHGPAAGHVAFQKQNPAATTAQYIINPAKLSRQQKLDLCALCHGGGFEKRTPSFEFSVGGRLSDHFVVDTAAPDPDSIDVHGNQYALLRASKCFRMSNTLTCNTCHNTHENEKGKIQLFSQRCIACHNNEHDKVCKLQKSMGAAINSNCIDCHMPLKPSRAIAVQLRGDNVPVAALIRSHFISIYPGETNKVLQAMQKIK